MVILITILNYKKKSFLNKKVACTGDWTVISRVPRFMLLTNRGHFFSQTGDNQDELAKIAITLETYKIAEWNFTVELTLSKCVIGKNENSSSMKSMGK